MSHNPIAIAPELSAREARLRYISGRERGYRRRRCGRGYSYLDPQGKVVRDTEQRQWLESLAIPPAWQEVWISPYRNGHILATGRDEKGRKQYIYHPRWTEQRKRTNFHQLLDFGHALPALRQRIDADLRRPGLCRERVVALVVYLLESTMIRVGNPEYARANRSYGLTTLREEHLEVNGNRIHFEFQGKSGRWIKVDLRDRRAARAIQRCEELPGQALFQYLDEDGLPRQVESADVNDYLSAVTGEEFTAKMFRTWGGSITAMRHLLQCPQPGTKKEAEANLCEAVKAASRQLRNTVTVCRQHYVHPRIGESYLAGDFQRLCGEPEPIDGLDESECALMGLLRAAK